MSDNPVRQRFQAAYEGKPSWDLERPPSPTRSPSVILELQLLPVTRITDAGTFHPAEAIRLRCSQRQPTDDCLGQPASQPP